MEENNTQLFEEEIYDSKTGKGFKKTFKNFSLLSFGKLGGDFFYFILFIVLSRKFGQVGIGQYSFAFGLTGFFAVSADFGLYSFTIKEISRNKDSFENYFQEIFSLRLVQSLIVLILLLLIIPFLSFTYDTKMIIAIVGIYMITYSIVDGISAVFIAHEFMYISAIIEMSLKIITSSCAIVVVILGGSIIMALVMLPVMSVLQLLIVKSVLKKKIGKVKISLSFKSLKKMFKRVFPFGSSDLLFQAYSRADVVLIGFLLGESFVGIYNVGYRLIFFLLFIPRFASITLFPIVSRLFHDSIFEFKKMYNKSLNMMIIIGLPLCVGLWLISPKLIELIFGDEFSESSIILKILSGLFLLNCFSYIMEIFLMASDMQNARAKSYWVATLVCILSNTIFILLFNIEGAAIAVMLSSFLLVILFALKLKPVVGLPHIKSRFLISVLGVLIFSLLFSIIPLSIFMVIPLSILIYIGTIMMFKDVRDNELRMVLDLIRKKQI